jgi:dTMP kinase
VDGTFISFEGIEGTGKSTQARLLARALTERGHSVVLTAEPGGTELGQRIRSLLLDVRHSGMEPVTELLLYSAARRQHLSEVIIPALEEGKVVITDRFSDSTLAYQGYARGLDRGLIASLDTWVTGGRKPHLTLLLDTDVETGLMRNRQAEKVDRLELEDVAFHRRVREGFRKIRDEEPERVLLVEVTDGVEEMHGTILSLVLDFLEKRKD